MEPLDTDPAPPTPGEVVPPTHRVLHHAPSDRYAQGPGAPGTPETPTGSLTRAAVGAIVPAAIGSGILVALASPMALVEPLVVVAVLLGLFTGLGSRWGGGTATPRGRRRGIAVVVALIAVSIAGFIVWRLALSEGGVLGLVDYELQVFGPIAILQPLSAVLAAWATT